MKFSLDLTELQKFYAKHIKRIKKCENCGCRIKKKGHKNVAHIIPKSRFKSVAMHDDNVMYLCCDLDHKDRKGCHDLYDYGWTKAATLPVWSIAKQRFQKFKSSIAETSIVLSYFEENTSL